ncbi:MAG: hypothetical protein V1834_02080 [Candidatus Micrarchaeota archaeon]
MIAVKEGTTHRAATEEDLERIKAHLQQNPLVDAVLPKDEKEAADRFEKFKSQLLGGTGKNFYQSKRSLD